MECHWNATSLPLVLSPKPVEKEGGKRCSAHGAQGEHPRTPPGRSCWESRGSGLLCSRPFLPRSNQNQIRERWCSTTCLWCFWKTLGALEARSFCLENFVLLLRGALPGIPAGNSGSGVGAPGAVGIWEGMRRTWDVTNPQPRCGIVTAQPSIAGPAQCRDFWGGKTEFPQCWGLVGASFRLRRRRNSGWQKRQQLQTQDE